MIANLDLQTLHISVKARLDGAKLNLMLLSGCSQTGTGSSNSLLSANESLSLKDTPFKTAKKRAIAASFADLAAPEKTTFCWFARETRPKSLLASEAVPSTPDARHGTSVSYQYPYKWIPRSKLT
jgi:hypothetical protein